MNTYTLKQIKSEVGQVCGVSKLRKDYHGHTNYGVLVKDLETSEKYWVNHYPSNGEATIKYSDYVRVVTFQNGSQSLQVVSREDTEF